MDYISTLEQTGCMLLKDLLIVSIPIYMKAHNWNPEDIVSNVYEAKKNHILRHVLSSLEVEVINKGKNKFVYGYQLKSIDPDNILIFKSDFFTAVYEDMKRFNMNIPAELYEILGVGSDNKVNEFNHTIHRAVCKGIAKTLWGIYPNLTITQMSNRYEILEFGDGKSYLDRNFLKELLREVAPVKALLKTQPKPKKTSKSIEPAIDNSLPEMPSKLIAASEIVTLNNTSSPFDKEDVIKESRREAGSMKGEKWRKFVADIIYSVVERELTHGCLCLHRDLAKLLKDELTVKAKEYFDSKEFKKIQPQLNKKIEDGIKDIFYRFGMEYGDVRSRVFRGKFYKNSKQTVCIHHTGK